MSWTGEKTLPVEPQLHVVPHVVEEKVSVKALRPNIICRTKKTLPQRPERLKSTQRCRCCGGGSVGGVGSLGIHP